MSLKKNKIFSDETEMAVAANMVQDEVFWVVTPPSSGWRWGQHGPLKRCILPQHYVASQSRRPWLKSSLLWKPQNSTACYKDNDCL